MMHLKFIFRSIVRQKLTTGIIIISLAIGLACINLIGIFINREMKTDRFHENSSRIYTLTCDDPWTNDGHMYQCREGSAEYIAENFSQVNQFCRLKNATAQKLVVNNHAWFDKPITIAASSNFFSFFSYQLLTNNPKTALESENNLVISEDLAKKYFGDEEPTGKVIKLINREKEEQFIVSGIFRKSVENTQIKFDMVRQISDGDSRCYVRLIPNAQPDEVEKQLAIHKTAIPSIHDGTPGQYYLEPFTETYFSSQKGSIMEGRRDKLDLLIALVIGIMIMGIAMFNYLGLLNNKLLEKLKEYAIRKINGGSKWRFILSFMIENLLIIFFSFALGILLMIRVSPFFNELTNTAINTHYFFLPEQLLIFLVVFVLLLAVTLLFLVLRIKPVVNTNLLKPSSGKAGKRFQVPAFNIFQIAVSVVLIFCSVIILKQIKYIADKPIGLDKEVIEIKIPASHKELAPAFREELLNQASVKAVSRTGASPVLEHFLILLKYKENGKEIQYSPAGFVGDEDFITTLGIEIIEGEGFSNNPESNKNKIVINQSLAKLFSGQNLIGQGLPGWEKKIVTGVVKDFHYSNLKSVVEPAFISFDSGGRHLLVKASDNSAKQINATIAGIWAKLIPDYPLSMETIGDRYEWLHRENKNYFRLIGACCAISIFLSMIGLFALSLQSSQYRTKEIGIRKVNGAKVAEIISLLNRDIIRWVAIAFAIACPVSYFAMSAWLENFAYKTSMNWWIFAFSGILALGISLLTVSFHSLKAARRNPVDALRYE